MTTFEFKQKDKDAWHQVRRDLNRYFQEVNEELTELFIKDYFEKLENDYTLTIKIESKKNK